MNNNNIPIRNFIFIFYIFFFINTYPAMVTYSMSGGRLGDNLLAYLHALWISFTYDIPLLYRPFKHGDQFLLHTQHETSTHLKPIILTQETRIEPQKNILYVVPYFSEDKTEHLNNLDWIYFCVDWHNPQFKQLMRKMLSPTNKQYHHKSNVKKNMCVAVHIRRGGAIDFPLSYENPNHISSVYADLLYPLKFPPLDFYVEQLKKLSELLHHKPMQAFIFTDDIYPKKIMRHLKNGLKKYKNITCILKSKKQKDPLDDFFAVTHCDCLIRSQSNFSLVAGKLADFLIEIFPDNYCMNNGKPQINSITIVQKNNPPSPNSCTATPHLIIFT